MLTLHINLTESRADQFFTLKRGTLEHSHPWNRVGFLLVFLSPFNNSLTFISTSLKLIRFLNIYLHSLTLLTFIFIYPTLSFLFGCLKVSYEGICHIGSLTFTPSLLFILIFLLLKNPLNTPNESALRYQVAKVWNDQRGDHFKQ